MKRSFRSNRVWGLMDSDLQRRLATLSTDAARQAHANSTWVDGWLWGWFASKGDTVQRNARKAKRKGTR